MESCAELCRFGTDLLDDGAESGHEIREEVEDSEQLHKHPEPRPGNANSHGARPVHLIITMMKWIRTSTFLMTATRAGMKFAKRLRTPNSSTSTPRRA